VDALTRVRLLPGGGGLGPEAVPRAEQALEHARRVRENEDVGALARACELLSGALTQLRKTSPGGMGR
jgi:molecular chaperone DnaK